MDDDKLVVDDDKLVQLSVDDDKLVVSAARAKFKRSCNSVGLVQEKV